MKKIIVATGNQHKLKELAALIKGAELEMARPFTCEETGATFCENALQKLHAAATEQGVCYLADDSGLAVEALGGAPGIHSARFGGESISQPERNKLLLDTLRGETNRNAAFVSVIAFRDESGQEHIFEGTVKGSILEAPRGNNGFGYDPVFFVTERGKSMAELSDAEKNKISHRARAAQQLNEFLENPSASDNKVKTVIKREQQKAQDTWDLSALCTCEADFYSKIEELKQLVPQYQQFRGTLAESKEALLRALEFDDIASILMERVYSYAFMKVSEDGGNPASQRMMGTAGNVSTSMGEQSAYFVPELLSIPEEKISAWIAEPAFKDYRISLEKLLRSKPHRLSEKEERLMALHSEVGGCFSDIFDDLTDVDFNFGEVDGKPLTNSTWTVFMNNPDRTVREKAYKQYYSRFEQYQHTIARNYSGSVKNDIFRARARNFSSSLENALFPDNVPKEVYTNLINAVHKGFPDLHRYYEFRRKTLGLDRLAHWDVYVPIIPGIKCNTPYDSAVALVEKALSPLGKDYTDILIKGLTVDRWVDRYENKGKSSGAYSNGTYSGNPNILLNYKSDVLRDVFTMAHEGGHSMHSYYSVRNNPYSCYNYSIFEAEVASTFNESLLADYLINNAENDKMRAYVIIKQMDDILATLFRQTMFAEYELAVHESAEAGEVLTAEFLRATYRKLLEQYFGSEVELPPQADLEGLRIPHFYRAFYVYKYATGISAALTLSDKVLHGTEKDLSNYRNFLKSGGSRYPLEALALAGVDMSSPEPVVSAIGVFRKRLEQAEQLLKS